MDHSKPQCGSEQNRRYSSPTKGSSSVANDGESAALSPHRTSMVDNLVVSPASSSIGSPSCDFARNGSVHDDEAPINPFLFDDDRDECNYSANSQNNLSRASLASSKSNADSHATVNNETQTEQDLTLNRVPSLNLSTYSGYDTDEDEDGVLRRFHDQARSSLQITLSLRSDDDESVYSAVNTSADIDEGNLHRNHSDASIFRSSSSHGENRTRKKKKKPTDHIKDAFHGMRKAHRDAQRLKSTRRFLAMSEGNRTAHSFTEAICLSPWCDFSYGRGLALMMSVLCFLVGLAILLSKFGHLAGGIWTCVLGITILLVRRFWVPIYWLVWGQFVEKRRRRNMQLYDSLNGERTGGVELSMQDGEVGFADEEEFGNADSSEPVPGELT